MSDKPVVTKWEALEAWIFDNDEKAFTARSLAASVRITTVQATVAIQAYLDAQRRENSNTLYVLKREGRTTASVWSVGHRTADAKVIGGTLFDDVAVKVRRAFKPDLERLAEKNPRAARYAEQKIAAVIDGALVVLASAVDAMIEDDES
jgi:uncharacterized protein YcbX